MNIELIEVTNRDIVSNILKLTRSYRDAVHKKVNYKYYAVLALSEDLTDFRAGYPLTEGEIDHIPFDYLINLNNLKVFKKDDE